MKRNLNILVVAIISFMMFTSLESCSSCSRSGRAKIAKQRSHRSNTSSKKPNEKTPKVVDDKNTETSSDSNVETTTTTNVAKLFRELEKGVFMVFALDDDGSGSQGSGFFINSSGIGITNYHVLEGHDDYFIKLSNGKKYRISKILEKSKPDDLDYVIFRVDKNGDTFKSLDIAKSKTSIGDDVFAIGSPRGLENSLTKGSVSQYRTNNRIQIDATIDHGSSGGPLFNMKGEVIGITSSGIEGSALNFAVDIQAVPYKKYIKKK